MEVYEVKPYGYCLGVLEAMSLAKKAREENPSLPCFVLGMLVHNEDAVKELSESGLKVLDERKGNLKDQLEDIPDGSVVIFSAHGHPYQYDEIAKRKDLIVYDATCRFVKENLDFASFQSKPIIYIGVRNHLESMAFLANVPDSIFYDVSTGACDFNKLTSSPIVLSQTTLSFSELEKAHGEILKRYPDAEFGKERCFSTSQRQYALTKIEEDCDVIIVLGSELSNNSRKLYEIGKNMGLPTFLCLGLEEMKKLDLSDYKKAALASGASTSLSTYKECKEYLLSL